MFSSNATQVSAVTQAEAVDFDTTNDYLSRSSDLIGNTDSKTFTFSGWVWRSGSDGIFFIDTFRASPLLRNSLQVQNDGNFQVSFYNASGTRLMNVTATAVVPLNTFTHILFSVDLNSTSNRYLYVNDVAVSPTWTTYVNDVIDFTVSSFYVGSAYTGAANEGRLSNVFLDYTYRDLSNSANRRLFVTADLKPAAGQAALNPILYLPMSDPTTVGTNAGTGGNFTLTGTVARSGRGPNQYNAPYSDLDGTADYLERTTALTGIADGKTFTFQCVFSNDVTTNGTTIFTIATSTTERFIIKSASGSAISLQGYDSAGNTVLDANIKSNSNVDLVQNRNYVLTISVDLTSTSNRYAYINGQAATVTWFTYSNTNIDFLTSTPRTRVGVNPQTGGYWNGRLGALWFNTSYIDLSQPANLAKFVTGTGIDAKPVDLGASGELPTGTSPLIYLPMYGNNAGKNYGTGGDFTVNSGPYTGARGSNEFWGNKADFDGTTGRLNKSGALTGITDGKTLSVSFWVQFDVSGNHEYWASTQNGAIQFELYKNNSDQLLIQGASGGLDVTLGGTLAINTPYFIQACFDMTNTSKRFIYVNGVLNSPTWTSYSNQNFTLTNATYTSIGARNTSYRLNGKLSEFYFTTDYIDFSQEANRLKFRDCFGNPTDLPSAITALSVPNPAIYMRFPPTSFGTNSGTGGNFTVNGTITDGGQL